jgi:ABC-type uncharacterized transport system involved in gliding motility auxiliary subunit
MNYSMGDGERAALRARVQAQEEQAFAEEAESASESVLGLDIAVQEGDFSAFSPSMEQARQAFEQRLDEIARERDSYYNAFSKAQQEGGALAKQNADLEQKNNALVADKAKLEAELAKVREQRDALQHNAALKEKAEEGKQAEHSKKTEDTKTKESK